ncbi:nucleosome assembly protein 1-like 1 isoform X2 [Stegodyphus dumicola]|uniref:nucleosome assembly protein 1-like 1 isoform X2 n=1 Tax=Stegodyphus dumicola TaxID=202533 RepID=UPI0015A7BD8C|nr:nucleosome assembly protein 1-like 1 isoform X2 [Stegodyphus dumicola]XP_035231329.1 nucleosome assembly protein 1-like 1 isoform X2 [Stegodyphus dumicola]
MGDLKDVGQAGEGPELKINTGDEAVDIEQNTAQDLKDGIMAALNHKSCSSNTLNLPKPVKRNVKALKKLQLAYVNTKVEYYKERHELEIKYEKKFEPLYGKQAAIVTGAVIPTDEECDFQLDSEKKAELSNEIQKVEDDTEAKMDVPAAAIKGIPKFWLTALKNGPIVADVIEEYDEPILEHLIDIKAITSSDPMGFYLKFHFEPNDYFTDTFLIKSYELKCVPDPTDVFSFDGLEIDSCKGCTIDWKRFKNVTVKTIKEKQKTRGAVRTVRKTVRNDSFFNFFNPPPVPKEGDQMDGETVSILNTDFRVGLSIKDRIIPYAVLYFTGRYCGRRI